MGELPLITFTISIQAAIGTIVFMMIAKTVQKDQEFKIAAFLAAVLSVVGVLASLLHLGTPTRALNALSNLGSSWLSREVLFSGIFMGLVVLYAILVYVKPAAKSALNAIGWFSALIGLIDVFMMAKVYTTSSIIAWQSFATFAEFYAASIVFGIVILLMTSIKQLGSNIVTYFTLTVAIAVSLQIAFTVVHYLNLGTMDGAGGASAALLCDMSGLVVAQWLFLILGAGLLLFSKIKEKQKKFAGYYVTGTVLCIGLIIGRYLFYAISVVTRVGLS